MQHIESILSEVEHLNSEEQLTLLEKLVAIIRKQKASDVKLSSISGVGAEIWRGMDINKYIETEREW